MTKDWSLVLGLSVLPVSYGLEMVCLSCRAWSDRPACSACLIELESVPDRILGGVVLARAPFAHIGAARSLVHEMKYRGSDSAALLLAEAIAAFVPVWATGFVPIPRAVSRRYRFGIDPAIELCRRVGELTDTPVVRVLGAPLFRLARAGRNKARSAGLGFRSRRNVEPGAVLVDDVITTGMTVVSALASMHGQVPRLVLAATMTVPDYSRSPASRGRQIS